MPGLSFFALSLVSTQARRACPIHLAQVVSTATEKAAQTKGAAPRRPAGRPQGSPNQNKAAVSLSPELQHIQAMVQAVLRLIAGGLSVSYWVLDGHWGNKHAWQMVHSCDLQLISKLRADSALYLPYSGPQAWRAAQIW